MVLGDFTQRPDDRKIEDRKPIAIDKNSFDEVLAFQTHPRLLRSQRCIHTPIYASSQRGSDVRFQQKAATPLRSLALDSRILVAAPCAGTSER
nr:type VI secretion system contractile sheath small subunit [Stutzerimonas stutzeri]